MAESSSHSPPSPEITPKEEPVTLDKPESPTPFLPWFRTKDKSPSHPSPPTPVVSEMHKEAQQAAGGPTSLGATSKEGAHPQLSSGMSAFILIEPVYSAPFICTLSLHQDIMLVGNKSSSRVNTAK
ncbi:hypothetical protein Tco_0244763, partial [Tanacetum coccineum]